MGRTNNDSKTSPLPADNEDHSGRSSFFSTIPLRNQVTLDDDENPGESSAVSSFITLHNHVPPEDDEPPAYTDCFAATPIPPRGPDTQRSFPPSSTEDHDISYRKTQNNRKGSTTTVLSRVMSSDPSRLQDFIASEARLMPNPTVRIMGIHTETDYRDKREESTTVTDFDITVSLANLLVSPWRRTRVVGNGVMTYRGGRMRSNAKDRICPAPSLKEWCHRFCASYASLKTFTLIRQVVNRDDKYLTDALTGVIRSTNYRGSISITFPLEDRATIVMPDHPINRYRTNRLIWWSCIILQLWIITWPLLWLMTKHWEVVCVYWPCRIFEDEAKGWPNADEEHPEVIHEGIRPDGCDVRRERDVRLATMSETSWVEDWRAAIVRAAEDQRRGTLRISDKNAANTAERRNAERAWETQQRFATASQSRFVGSVTGLLRGESDRDSRLALGWGANS
ncbi:hypothetical protein MMC07_003432 [Pseudocyphellaria aurata]|nr:hypothetical protein [Pseudocyphellaria aurata]